MEKPNFFRNCTGNWWEVGETRKMEEEKNVVRTIFPFRYFLDDKSVAATLSFRGIDFSFWHLINSDNQFATSFIYNRKNNCSLGTIFYQWMYNDVRVRGSIDSDGAIGVTYFR